MQKLDSKFLLYFWCYEFRLSMLSWAQESEQKRLGTVGGFIDLYYGFDFINLKQKNDCLSSYNHTRARSAQALTSVYIQVTMNLKRFRGN